MALFASVRSLARCSARIPSTLSLVRAISSSPIALSKETTPKKKSEPAAAAAPAAPAASSTSNVSNAPLDSIYTFRGVPGRYSKVLLEHARKHGQLQTVRDDLRALEQACQSSYEFRAMFHRVPLDQIQTSDLTKVFIEQLRAQGHVHHFGNIVKTYESALRELLNEQHLTIVTATPLTAAQIGTIKEIAGRNTGGQVIVDTEVDPSIMGGMIVHTDDTVFDVSLKSLLRKEFSSREIIPATNQEKRIRAALESAKIPDTPNNAAFLERVRNGVRELTKQSGLNEILPAQ